MYNRMGGLTMTISSTLHQLKGALDLVKLESLCNEACIESQRFRNGKVIYSFIDGSLCRFMNASWCKEGRIMQHQDRRITIQH